MASSKIRELETDLESQVASLRKEISSLTRLVSKRGSEVYEGSRDGAVELYEELWNRVSDALPKIGKQAKAANKVAHDNPMITAVVGVAVVGLVIGLLARR